MWYAWNIPVQQHMWSSFGCVFPAYPILSSSGSFITRREGGILEVFGSPLPISRAATSLLPSLSKSVAFHIGCLYLLPSILALIVGRWDTCVRFGFTTWTGFYTPPPRITYCHVYPCATTLLYRLHIPNAPRSTQQPHHTHHTLPHAPSLPGYHGHLTYTNAVYYLPCPGALHTTVHVTAAALHYGCYTHFTLCCTVCGYAHAFAFTVGSLHCTTHYAHGLHLLHALRFAHTCAPPDTHCVFAHFAGWPLHVVACRFGHVARRGFAATPPTPHLPHIHVAPPSPRAPFHIPPITPLLPPFLDVHLDDL